MAEGPDQSADLDRLDLDEIRRFLRRRWRLIVGTAVGAVVLAAIVCLSVTPTYTATSQVLLDPRRQHVFGTDSVGADSGLDSSIVDSQIPIILSTRLLAKVVDKEHLLDDPEFGAPARPGLLERLLSIFKPAKTAVQTPSFDGIDPKLAPVILRLFNRIDVTRVQKSYVLSIAVATHEAGKSMRLANALAETYVEDQIEVHAHAVQQAADFFQDRLGSLRDQVRESERAVAEFRKAHNLTPISTDRPLTVGQQQVQDLNDRLAQASAETAGRLAAYKQALQFKASGTDLDSLPEIIRSPVITQLRTQQAELTRRAADLSAMYGPAYPAITQIAAQRAGLAHAIQAEMTRLVSTFKNDYEVARAREGSLRQSIATLSASSGGDDDVGVKLRELERTNLANKALFENFLNRAKLTQEQSTFEEPDARLISPALEPSSPSFPKIKIIVPVAGLVGLLLGLGLAVLLDLARSKGRTAPARASAFILGRVPSVPGWREGHADCAAYLQEHPGSPFATAMTAIAARLRPAKGEPARAVMLAALGHGEGATSLVLCLAAAAAADGRRVLAVDADPVGRGLSVRLGLAERAGLAELLLGEVAANKAVVPHPRFAVLPAGLKPLDATGHARRLRAFLDEARHRFDLVLLDGPTFEAGAEALDLAAACDGLAIVASWDGLLREDFIQLVDTVADRPGFAGIILNRATGAEDAMKLAS